MSFCGIARKVENFGADGFYLARHENAFDAAVLAALGARDEFESVTQAQVAGRFVDNPLQSACLGRADGWIGTRPFRVQESAGIQRVLQTHDGTRAVGNAQASCPSSDERDRNLTQFKNPSG